MREKYSQIDKVPPLNGLRVFEAAARHLSFVRAAHELHVTHGAVSRQVKQLEEQLGVQLFERRNRAIFLTSRGSVLFDACSEAMSHLGQAIRRIKAPSDDQELPLVVSCEPTIAMRWLIPRLPTFAQRYPDNPIHLLTAGGKVDFARGRVDVALRRNDFGASDGHHIESVAPEMMGPVCAPEQAASVVEHGAAGAPVRLLHSHSRPSAWSSWQSRLRIKLKVSGDQRFEHFYLSLQAASAGLGVALGSAYMVEDDLRDGRLVAPLGFVPDGSEYILLSEIPFAEDPRRLLFLDWIRHEMAKSRHELEILNRLHTR